MAARGWGRFDCDQVAVLSLPFHANFTDKMDQQASKPCKRRWVDVGLTTTAKTEPTVPYLCGPPSSWFTIWAMAVYPS